MRGPKIHRRAATYSIAFAALLTVGACTDVPELDEAVPDWLETAEYPDPLPLKPGDSISVDPSDEALRNQQSLEARRDRLRKRVEEIEAANS